MAEPSFKERRRFQRVILKDMEGSLAALLGAKAKWSNGERVVVYDISHSGMALARPKNLELEKELIVVLGLELPGHPLFNITAEVMWCNDSVVGLNFEPLNVTARKRVGDFLADKIVGLHLQLIDEKFYDKSINCDLWFQGPYGTNVYMWTENANIEKAIIEFAGELLVYEKGDVKVGGAEEAEELGYDRNSEIVMPSVATEKNIRDRCIDILSQAEGDEQRFLKKLLAELVELSD